MNIAIKELAIRIIMYRGIPLTDENIKLVIAIINRQLLLRDSTISDNEIVAIATKNYEYFNYLYTSIKNSQEIIGDDD